MKTKKIKSKTLQFAMFCLAMLIFSTGFAQKDTSNFAKKKQLIDAQKSAYITKKLELTTTEAQAFWPVYNEYDAKKDVILKANKENHKKAKNIDEISDKEAQAIIDAQLLTDEKLLALKKEYMAKFTSVIPVKKVVKLEMAEKEFRKELLKVVKAENKKNVIK